jgi:hypothetical protein
LENLAVGVNVKGQVVVQLNERLANEGVLVQVTLFNNLVLDLIHFI